LPRYFPARTGPCLRSSAFLLTFKIRSGKRWPRAQQSSDVRTKRTTVGALPAKEDTAVRIGIIFDPLNPAAASDKLLYGFLHLLGVVAK
jgi:hypothetical protein